MMAPMQSVGMMKFESSDRLAEFLDIAGIGDAGGVGDMHDLTLPRDDLVSDVGRRLDQGEVALAFEPLLDDLHVEHAEEAATEAESQGVGRLGLEGKARIIKRQFLQGCPQIVELVVGCGEEPAEDDGDRLLVAGQGRPGPGRGPG